MTSSMVDQTQNEETLRAIFNANKETAFVIKIDGTVVAINETGAARLGQRPEEMIGKSIYQFVPPEVVERRKLLIEQVIATGQPMTFEDERLGSYIFNSLSPIFNEKGQMDKIAVFGLDITARKKAELILQQHTEDLEMIVEERTTALRQANVQLNEEIDERKQAEQRIAEALAFNRHILDTAPVGIVGYQASGQAIQVNEAAAVAIGATVEQILQQNFRQLTSWKKTRLYAAAEEALLNNVTTRIDLPVRTTFGKEVRLDCRFVPFRWNNQPHLLLIFVDMTEYRRIQNEREAALAFSEQAKTAAEMIDNMLDPVVITDIDGRIRQFNRAFMDAYGYGEEVIGKLPTEIVRTEDIPAVLKSIEQTLAEGVVYNLECTIMTREGRQIPVLNNISLIRDEGGNPKGFLTVLRDITKRKEIENALTRSEEKFRLAAERISDLIYEWDIAAGSLVWSERIDDILGYDTGEFPRTIEAWEGIIHSDDYPRVAAALDNHLKTAAPYHEEYRVRRKDGAMLIWNDQGIALRDEKGCPYRMIGACSDITEVRKKDKFLRESENSYRTLSENLPGMVFRVHLQEKNRMQFFNGLTLPMTGYSPEKLEAGEVCSIDTLILPEDHRGVVAAVRSSLRSKQAYEITYRIQHQNGEIRYFSERGKPVYDGEGKPLYIDGVIFDVTERKKSEEALQSAHEEMERSYADLEQYAYVASHDLQEPLRMIVSYLQLIEKRYRDKLDDDGKAFMDFAVDGAARMQTLIRDLLAYARVGRGGLNLKPTDLNALVGEVLDDLKMTVEESGADVTVDALPVVMADRSQMAQLLQNLISNAVKFRGAQAPEIQIGAQLEDENWLIFVRDNGIGIDKAHLEKTFTMFQRLQRREDYVGTGVGLAIAKRIVERHRGRIWIESALGAGTTVYFTLPVHAGSEG